MSGWEWGGGACQEGQRGEREKGKTERDKDGEEKQMGKDREKSPGMGPLRSSLPG